MGQSLLIDPARLLFIDVAWPNALGIYRGAEGLGHVRHVQDDVWRRLLSWPLADTAYTSRARAWTNNNDSHL